MSQMRTFVGFGVEPKGTFLEAYEIAKKKMGVTPWVVQDVYFSNMLGASGQTIIATIVVRYGED